MTYSGGFAGLDEEEDILALREIPSKKLPTIRQAKHSDPVMTSTSLDSGEPSVCSKSEVIPTEIEDAERYNTDGQRYSYMREICHRHDIQGNKSNKVGPASDTDIATPGPLGPDITNVESLASCGTYISAMELEPFCVNAPPNTPNQSANTIRSQNEQAVQNTKDMLNHKLDMANFEETNIRHSQPSIKTTISNFGDLADEEQGDSMDDLPYHAYEQPFKVGQISMLGESRPADSKVEIPALLSFPVALLKTTAEPHGGRRQSFAGYSKSRRASTVTDKSSGVSALSGTSGVKQERSMSCTSGGNLHRTMSGLGMMGSALAEEENTKSPIISMLEANVRNKHVKTFYNGIQGVLEDRKRQDKLLIEEKKFIIHPLSSFRLIWDSVLLVSIFITLTILPVKLSFYNIFDDTRIDLHKTTWYITTLMIDSIFFMDVILNFFTGAVMTNESPPIICLDRAILQKKYLKSWFVPDVLSSIPFDVIGSEIQQASSQAKTLAIAATKTVLLAKILKIFALIRVLRFGRLVFITKRWMQIFEVSPLMVKILSLMGQFFLIAHWSACLQFFIVYCRDFPEKTWPMKLGIRDSPVFEQYAWSFFRSLSHMLTIGYGKDPPEDILEVILMIPSIVTGAFFYMMIISQMSQTIFMFNISRIRYSKKMTEVDEFAKNHKLPGDLHQRMHEFFHHKHAGEIHDDDVIVKELPLALRIDILRARMSSMLENVLFLQSACDGFLEQYLLRAKPEVFMTGDIILRSEDSVDKLYVISKGTVSIEYTTEGNDLKAEVLVNQFGFFGETPMVTKRKSNMMVFAETPCDLHTLPSSIFYMLMERYPLFKNQMMLVVYKRLQMQGINPLTHAPHCILQFQQALQVEDEISGEGHDVLELASQVQLSSHTMEQFRQKNSCDYSVFRKPPARKTGEPVPSDLTPRTSQQHFSDQRSTTVSDIMVSKSQIFG